MIKKQTILALAITSIAGGAFASQVNEVTGADQQAILNLLNGQQTFSNNPNSYAQRSVSDDGLHIRYDQYFKGIRVLKGEIVSHKTKSILVSADEVTGYAVSGLAPNAVVPQLSAKEAISKAQAAHPGHDVYKNQEAELLIANLNGEDKLVYQVQFNAEGGVGQARPLMLIDALNGEVLEDKSNLNFERIGTGPGGNDRMGKIEYGSGGKGYLDVQKNGNTCKLWTTNVNTINMNHATSGGSTHSFNCPRNTVKSINGAYSPLNDAHYGGVVTFDMYKSWYNAAPITQQLTLRVHYDHNWENATWDGQTMQFGDGGNNLYPLAVLGVVAHEVSHGYTQQNSNLEYSGQSGGMNEAFSDMAGEAAECFDMDPNGVNCNVDWMVGKGIMKNSTAMRYFIDPTQDGRSIGHASNFTSSMDVHHSSGVYNRAFYLLATSSGWNMRKAFDVMVDANKNYWTRYSTFSAGAGGVCKAAEARGYDASAVTKAFDTVGVTHASCPTGPKQGTPVTVTDSGSLATGQWKHYGPYNSVESLTATTTGTGDVDMYVKQGSQASTTLYDCKSTTPQAAETCTVPAGQNIYVGIHAYSQMTYNLTVNYHTDDVIVDNQAPVVSVSAPSVATAGDVISLTANASDADGSVSSVAFYVNGGLVSTDTSAPYAASYTTSVAGNLSVTAIATDNKNASTTSSAVNVTVQPGTSTNVPPTVSITSPANGTQVNEGANVNITAQASDADGTVSKVEFFVGGVLIASDSTAPYSANYAANSTGVKSITAIAYDDKNATTSSSAVSITVNGSTNTGCGNIAPWSASETYLGGDQVSRLGNIYRAAWWTTGNAPESHSGPWQEWVLVGPCS